MCHPVEVSGYEYECTVCTSVHQCNVHGAISSERLQDGVRTADCKSPALLQVELLDLAIVIAVSRCCDLMSR